MYFRQFYLPSLGHASYLIGSDETGEALVFDPRRDVDAYFEAARGQGMRIAYAADSHQHNDYLWEACWQLLRIGYDLPAGWLAGGMFAWRTAARPLATLPQWTVAELRDHLARDRDVFLLDVRQPAEWSRGHIDRAVHITGAELPGRLDEVPRDRPVAVVCGSGYRSSVAASLLARRNARQPIANVPGGMSAWQASGYPVVDASRRPAPATASLAEQAHR